VRESATFTSDNLIQLTSTHSKDNHNLFINTSVLIDDELLQTQPLQNNLLSDFERDEDEKMNFSFTADGVGLGGNEASVNTATKWAPV